MNQIPSQSLHDLYVQVARRKARKERCAMIAYVVLAMLATVTFVVCLFTPQP